MRAIKEHLVLQFLLLILCSGHSTAQVLSGNTPDSYSLSMTGMSPDGHWATAQLLRDGRLDSTIVVDTRHGGAKAFSDVKRSIFVGNSLVMLKGGGTAFVYDHMGTKTLELRNVIAVEDIGNPTHFLIKGGRPGRSVVSLLNLEGKILDSIADAQEYYIHHTNGEALVTAGADQEGTSVYSLGAAGKRHLYSTSNSIAYIQYDAATGCILLFEQQHEGARRIITLLDRRRQKRHVLTDLLDEEFSSISIQPLAGEQGYFIRTEVPVKKDDQLVDIWLKDSALESKLIPYPVEHAYLWYPEKSKLQQLSTVDLPKVEYIGSNRFFLAFDPQKLQDYTSGSPNLEVFLLDLESSDTTPLGIFGPDITVSPKGNHVLCREEGQWVLIDLKRKTR